MRQIILITPVWWCPIFYVPTLLKWCCRLCLITQRDSRKTLLFDFFLYELKPACCDSFFCKNEDMVPGVFLVSVLSGEITLTEFMEGAKKDQWLMDLLNLDVNTSGWVTQNCRKLPWCLAVRAASSWTLRFWTPFSLELDLLMWHKFCWAGPIDGEWFLSSDTDKLTAKYPHLSGFILSRFALFGYLLLFLDLHNDSLKSWIFWRVILTLFKFLCG